MGAKVFRREMLEIVVPLLLIKRYAFDLEVLAVGTEFGFDRVEEIPVRSTTSSPARASTKRPCGRMFLDTLAIAYRIHVRHWYVRQFAALQRERTDAAMSLADRFRAARRGSADVGRAAVSDAAATGSVATPGSTARRARRGGSVPEEARRLAGAAWASRWGAPVAAAVLAGLIFVIQTWPLLIHPVPTGSACRVTAWAASSLWQGSCTNI